MSRTLIKFVVSLFVITALVNASYAQDEANMPRPNTKAGSAAWMFEFGGLATMGLNGFNIENNFSSMPVVAAGWKWYFADDMALRALLGFATASSGSDSLAPFKSSSTAFGIAVGVELHTHAVYSTSPYFGAQISFGTGSNDLTNKSVGETKTSGTAFGIGVLAGFDWYFTRGIAVGGEYMLGFTTKSGSTTFTPKGGSATTTDDPSATNLGISSGSVHVIVHF
ncbi:MAG: outer membrane beta-barrel protein [Bacteroidota bacterium]|nr:outer membrane beta-barrel protein [Bacteroidota bacterium]MDP4230850.1 outer membrane beta-barrel protein [Bacteroidota bacterium]MDP4235662.1 outer membrane beta-barrel protein [Bacteroidota bacterium]